MLNDMPVTVIAIDRGKDTKEKIKRNFGSAHPEGYRKALRQMKLAEKFNRPVICFIDTSGAYCGIGAEERGQAQAIAENLMEMMTLKVPIISIFTGEGESGGALARGGRRGLDAGKRGLLGHLAGGLRQHPLEGRLQDKGSLRVLEAHRRGAFKPQGGRAFNPRAEGPKGRAWRRPTSGCGGICTARCARAKSSARRNWWSAAISASAGWGRWRNDSHCYRQHRQHHEIGKLCKMGLICR